MRRCIAGEAVAREVSAYNSSLLTAEWRSTLTPCPFGQEKDRLLLRAMVDFLRVTESNHVASQTKRTRIALG